MATPHFTLAVCPNCGAEEKAVGHWTSSGAAKWYCFNCRATGTMNLHIDNPVKDPPDVSSVPSSDVPG